MSHFYDGWNTATAEDLLDEFSIDPNAWVKDLSVSERIKLALVCAAGHNPLLLLLDNPMVHLNERARNEVSHFLRTRTAKNGTGVVVSARRSSELPELCDFTLALADGKARECESENRVKMGL